MLKSVLLADEYRCFGRVIGAPRGGVYHVSRVQSNNSLSVSLRVLPKCLPMSFSGISGWYHVSQSLDLLLHGKKSFHIIDEFLKIGKLAGERKFVLRNGEVKSVGFNMYR